MSDATHNSYCLVDVPLQQDAAYAHVVHVPVPYVTNDVNMSATPLNKYIADIHWSDDLNSALLAAIFPMAHLRHKLHHNVSKP